MVCKHEAPKLFSLNGKGTTHCNTAYTGKLGKVEKKKKVWLVAMATVIKGNKDYIQDQKSRKASDGQERLWGIREGRGIRN